jgi:hypothetical protein
MSPGVHLQYANVKIGGKVHNLGITGDSAKDPVLFVPSTVLASLPKGDELSFTLYFSDPGALLIAYVPKVYSDPFDS